MKQAPLYTVLFVGLMFVACSTTDPNDAEDNEGVQVACPCWSEADLNMFVYTSFTDNINSNNARSTVLSIPNSAGPFAGIFQPVEGSSGCRLNGADGSVLASVDPVATDAANTCRSLLARRALALGLTCVGNAC